MVEAMGHKKEAELLAGCVAELGGPYSLPDHHSALLCEHACCAGAQATPRPESRVAELKQGVLSMVQRLRAEGHSEAAIAVERVLRQPTRTCHYVHLPWLSLVASQATC